MNDLMKRMKILLGTPTAPFREMWVCEEIDRMLDDIPDLELKADRFGNRIARLRRGNPPGIKFIFIAHMDHPGFIFDEEHGASLNQDHLYEAVFEGRVQDSFFENGPVRLFRSHDDPGVKGRVLRAEPVNPTTDNRRILIEAPEEAEGAKLAMWDVTSFSFEDGQFKGRACDDLAGCVSIIETLARLAESDEELDVSAIFSRAEEAGFCGVASLLNEETLPEPLPQHAVFISVEASSELPGIRLGDGVLIRIGDKAFTFDGPLSDALFNAAKRRRLNAKRALMDAGTCEASPFIASGHRAGGICIPLRNYHNMDIKAGKIAQEMVDSRDVEQMVQLMTALAGDTSLNTQDIRPPLKNMELYVKKGYEYLEPIPLHGKVAAS